MRILALGGFDFKFADLHHGSLFNPLRHIAMDLATLNHERLDHANLTVVDIDRAVAFTTALPSWRVRGRGRMDWFGTTIRWLHVGNDDSYLALQDGGQGEAMDWRSRRIGAKHLGITGARPRRGGAAAGRRRLGDGPPGGTHPHRRSAYYVADELVQIEFMQYLSAARATQRLRRANPSPEVDRRAGGRCGRSGLQHLLEAIEQAQHAPVDAPGPGAPPGPGRGGLGAAVRCVEPSAGPARDAGSTAPAPSCAMRRPLSNRSKAKGTISCGRSAQRLGGGADAAVVHQQRQPRQQRLEQRLRHVQHAGRQRRGQLVGERR